MYRILEKEHEMVTAPKRTSSMSSFDNTDSDDDYTSSEEDSSDTFSSSEDSSSEVSALYYVFRLGWYRTFLLKVECGLYSEFLKKFTPFIVEYFTTLFAKQRFLKNIFFHRKLVTFRKFRCGLYTRK